ATRSATPRRRPACSASRAMRAARFPQTVHIAAELLGNSKPMPASSVASLTELLQTPDGARGALVAVLSDARLPHCDEPLDERFVSLVERVAARDDAMARDLRALLVTNLVMPTAMTVYYAERAESQLLEASRLTAARAAALLRAVAHIPPLQQVADEFVTGLRCEQGAFGAFGAKWGYGPHQREKAIQAIRAAVPPFTNLD
ncbi:unnamed protein product, partial [Agarophyton chilense]